MAENGVAVIGDAVELQRRGVVGIAPMIARLQRPEQVFESAIGLVVAPDPGRHHRSELLEGGARLRFIQSELPADFCDVHSEPPVF